MPRSGSENTLTINKDYLAIQPVGSLTFTIEFDKGNAAILTIDITDKTSPSGSNPPTWPVGSTLTASGTTKTRTTLSWTAAADDVGVTGYRIYQDNSLFQTVSGAVYSCEVTGLSSSTTRRCPCRRWTRPRRRLRASWQWAQWANLLRTPKINAQRFFSRRAFIFAGKNATNIFCGLEAILRGSFFTCFDVWSRVDLLRSRI